MLSDEKHKRLADNAWYNVARDLAYLCVVVRQF
jgi:hypothetical protein